LALIGTISGSNGTTTSAVTGSLIIAADPGTITPVRPTDVVLYVSGAATSVGADQPSILFKGDAFTSGAFGTDSYIQMKPVGTLRIPTNATASYIYTSGSTNDLYFTQYNGPYTNTTRLRWLESALGTGLLSGGTLSSTSGSTTYNIASGSGLIVTYNAYSLEGPADQIEPFPVITRVTWPDLNAQALPSLSTTQITYVGIDSTGTPYLKSTPFVNGDYDTYISLGRILHTDKVGTNGAVNQPTVSYGQTHFRGDFVRAFGPIKLSGHTFSANGTQGLQKEAGDSYAEGRNYTVDPDSPNYVTSTSDTAQLTSKIFYEYVNAAGDDVIANNGNLGYTALDFANYNNAGTLTAVGSGNKFTIQRVFWFPNGVNRAFYVYYGNEIYATLDDAQAGIGTEVFTEGKNTRDAAIFLGYAIVKGTGLNFTDPTTYRIIQAGPFRAVASAGAGATGTPGGANTYVQFNDSSVFNGTSDFRFEKSTGTALVNSLVVTGSSAGSLVSSGTFQVKSNTGAVVGSISTGGIISGSSDLQIGGNITGSNAQLAGDLAVNGGDITSTAPTLNIASTANTTNVYGSALLLSATGLSTLSGSSLDLKLGSTNPITIWRDETSFLTIASGTYTAGGTTLGQAARVTAINSNNLVVGSSASTFVSGTTAVVLNAGSSGAIFHRDGIRFLTISSGSGANANIGGQTNLNLTIGSAGTGGMFVSGSTVTLNAGSAGFFIQRDGANIGTITGVAASSFTIAPGSGIGTVNIASGSGTTVNIGASTGRTTIFNDLAIGTGNIIGAPGTGNNVMTLISSGNIVAKLDTDASAEGHRFAIQDWRNIDQFFVGENGNAELSGSLVVSGTTNMGTTVERMSHYQTTGSVIAFDMTFTSIFYVNNPNNDITANFTNLSTVSNNRIVTPTVILSQSGTGRTITAVQVDGVEQTPIKWANGVTPTATANKQEVFGFSLIRSGSAWAVLGQLSSYG
jgi:hypothetical protein